MSNAEQKASYWGQIIGWLVALGVPMTPLQGTYIGYGILLIAAVLTLWKAFAWVRDLNIQISHTAQGPISPTLVKTMFLMPVCFLFVLAGLLSYYAGISSTIQQSSTQSNPASHAISIVCSPENLPIPGKHPDSLFAVYLHPRWGNELVTFLYGTLPDATYWPDSKTLGIAYRCDISNISTSHLTGLVVPFRVAYRSQARQQRDRTIEIGLPTELEPGKPFVLHIIDDSGWDPQVVLPEQVYGRIRGEQKSTYISVEYLTMSGEPMRLGGFGPH